MICITRYTSILILRKDYHGISNIKRRQEILNYIREKSGCNKEAVVQSLDKDGIASRMVTLKILSELEQENIIRVDWEKDNSRSCKLYVDPQNLLVTVPKSLEDIFFRFESFLDIVGKISQSEIEISSRMDSSIFGETLDKNTERNYKGNALTSIPFIMLDVINDIITFSFLFFLSRKIGSISSLSKVYSNYFEKLATIYPTISSKLSDATSTYYDTVSKSFQYMTFLKSKDKSGFKKVGYLTYLCYQYDIAKEMYEVLDLLWINNVESVSKVYDQWYIDNLFRDHNRNRYTRSDQFYVSHLEQLRMHNDHLVHNNENLNKIHEAINLYIALERYSPDIENWRPSGGNVGN